MTYSLLPRLLLVGVAAVCAAGGVLAQTAPPDATASRSPDATSVWDGVYVREQAERGDALYFDHCASCHGEDLSGNTPYSASPSVAGRSFRLRWRDRTMAELFTVVRERMPMEKPGSLKRDQYLDITAFLLQANQYPEGVTPLTDDASVLWRIKMTFGP